MDILFGCQTYSKILCEAGRRGRFDEVFLQLEKICVESGRSFDEASLRYLDFSYNYNDIVEIIEQESFFEDACGDSFRGDFGFEDLNQFESDLLPVGSESHDCVSNYDLVDGEDVQTDSFESTSDTISSDPELANQTAIPSCSFESSISDSAVIGTLDLDSTCGVLSPSDLVTMFTIDGSISELDPQPVACSIDSPPAERNLRIYVPAGLSSPFPSSRTCDLTTLRGSSAALVFLPFRDAYQSCEQACGYDEFLALISRMPRCFVYFVGSA